MKKLTQILALVLAVIMMLTVLLASCEKVEETTADNENTTEAETNKKEENGKFDYTVSIQTIGGRPISGNTFHIYEGDDLKAYGKTDENGIGVVSLTPSDNYSIEISDSGLDGYHIDDRYYFTNGSANIVLTSSVILDTDLTGVQYELGDIMHDFKVTTTDGEVFQLSEALKTKKAVLINFWYSTCSPCINEFPFMQSAYEKYQDSIEVIALNSYAGDNEADVVNFKNNMGLTFPVAKDYSGLYSAFTPLVTSIYGQTGYPTSIFIDRYGAICLVELGGLTSEKPFVAAFDHFIADDYKQTLIESISTLTPVEKPNIEMPSSEEIGAVLNGKDFTALYTPETESSDAEYSWPFIIGEKNGVACVYPSNKNKGSSFATLHATVNLKAGEALAIDWFADTEKGVDMLYILVDGKDIYTISGNSTDWDTCYPYVAVEDGEYKVTFIYLKDDSTDTGDDVVYLKNFRKVNKDAIDKATYIPRQAATKPNANGLGYQAYITPVFNAKDGYYHVNNENGPLLLVNLMGSTQLNEESLNQLGYDGKLIDDQGDVYERLVDYCNYSINGNLYGYSPVTEELRALLERAAASVGFEVNNPNQWLQACSYYNAYGTDVQLEDPVKGIAFFAAFETLESTDTEDIFNTVTYDGRVIMPRGLKYKFVPTKSGAYIIKSQSEDEVNGWIFDENYEIIHTASITDRPYNVTEVDTVNVSMVIYLEAGKTYYIDIAYYDIYGAGTFTFTVKFIAESYKQFHVASPGYFTFHESTGGQINETIAGGINVQLGSDGYYHELREDGSLGSIVYADFLLPTEIFSQSIQELIKLGAFNFALSESDQIVINKLNELGGDVNACRNYYKELWGEAYAEWEEIYQLEEVLAGIYHGDLDADFSEAIKEFEAKMLPKTDSAPELEGCVPVDATLATILQKLMDKFTFQGVTNSWTKLCYYYKQVGPEIVEPEEDVEIETESESTTEIETEVETETNS